MSKTQIQNLFGNKRVAWKSYVKGPEWGWNYPDALFVGKGGMTLTEYQTMFTLWCIIKSPLMLGNDLRNMEETDEAYKVSK